MRHTTLYESFKFYREQQGLNQVSALYSTIRAGDFPSWEWVRFLARLEEERLVPASNPFLILSRSVHISLLIAMLKHSSLTGAIFLKTPQGKEFAWKGGWLVPDLQSYTPGTPLFGHTYLVKDGQVVTYRATFCVTPQDAEAFQASSAVTVLSHNATQHVLGPTNIVKLLQILKGLRS